MHLLYNGQIYQESELRLPINNRAFQYNDGFFETMVWEKDKLRLLEEHLERMQEAATILGLELPVDLGSAKMQGHVQALAEKNDCSALGRIKLKIWRAGAGLYTPQTNTVDWLLTAQPMNTPSLEPVSLGICRSVHTQSSPFSSFKGPHSLVYVMASREKRDRNLEDLLLLDADGHLAELTYSNLFWVKRNILYTPSLATGCLNGVMRRRMLKKAKAADWHVEEGTFHPDVLQEADVVFSSNVMGLPLLQILEGRMLRVDAQLLEEFRKMAM